MSALAQCVSGTSFHDEELTPWSGPLGNTRFKMTTASARVTALFGRKVPSSYPLNQPAFQEAATASATQCPAVSPKAGTLPAAVSRFEILARDHPGCLL